MSRRRPTAPAGTPSRSYSDRIRWIEVRNDSADDVPGGGLVRVTGTITTADSTDTADAGYGIPTVDAPDEDSQGELLVAHPAGISAGGFGLATPGDFVPVRLDPDAGTPAVGEDWGSEAGSFYLHSGQTGWRIGAGRVQVQDLRLVESWRVPVTVEDVRPYPLQELPCLLGVPTNVTGMAQIWYDPVTGIGQCRTSGFCGCPPATPPDPETSCCSLWYCTIEDGYVEVAADADGVYTPPAGWDGNPPSLTEAEADAVCGLRWWCVGTNQPLVEAPLNAPPTGYTDGPFDTEAEADAACPLLFGDCATEYSRTLVVTHTGFTGGCSGYNGSVNLPWDGTKWVGTYAAPAGNVTYDITPGVFSGGTATWNKSYTSSAYTLSGWTGSVIVACGAVPAGGVLTLTGGCSGGGTVGITEL